MANSQIIILAILATSIATYISRFMGALTSEKVSVKSKIFKWFNCVAISCGSFSRFRSCNETNSILYLH